MPPSVPLQGLIQPDAPLAVVPEPHLPLSESDDDSSDSEHVEEPGLAPSSSAHTVEDEFDGVSMTSDLAQLMNSAMEAER